MAADPRAPQSQPKTEPAKDAGPSMADLMALIKSQGEQIAALTAKTQQIATPVRHEVVGLPDALHAAPPWSIRVRATKAGFYPNKMPDGSRSMRHQRRFGRDESYGGDVFVLEKASDFAGGPHGWMELATEEPQKVQAVPATTVPNLVQDPMGAPAGNAQRVIES